MRRLNFDAKGLTTALGREDHHLHQRSLAAPFGALDQPGLGAVVGGPGFGNVGWVKAHLGK